MLIVSHPSLLCRDSDHDDDADHDVNSDASETYFNADASETQPILMLTGPQAGFQQQAPPPAPGQGSNS